MKEFSKEDLNHFNHLNVDGKIYVSIFGDVFDVSKKRDLYSGGYKILTGKDATVLLGESSH